MDNRTCPQQRRRVYFHEFNVLMEGTAYLPFATGLLAAYAQSIEPLNEHYEFMPFLFIRKPVEHLVAEYERPSVAAFSVSMWNEQLSLTVAAEIKQRYPSCLIVFGGPQVPHQAADYFARYGFIDLTVRGDGEIIFSRVLERFIRGTDFSGIPNISWRAPATGACVANDDAPPDTEELDRYPSPYLTGIFEYLFTQAPQDISYQAILETNRGCPFACSYCFWGKGGRNKQLRYHRMERIAAEIEWCGRHQIRYVFNADSNFGIHPRDRQIADLLVATKKRYGYPEKFRACFTKDSGEAICQIVERLVSHQLEKGVTLSFQSLEPQVIRNVRRHNISLDTYQVLLVACATKEIPVYTEFILGLPGETLQSWVRGIESVLAAGLTGQLFIYPCEVYPNTELADQAYQARFGIVTTRISLTEIHGRLRQSQETGEYQDIITQTASMPRADWRRMMVFSWMAMLLWSMKLGFFVLRYFSDRFRIAHTDFISYLCAGEFSVTCPQMQELLAFYQRHLDQLLAGGGRGVVLPEYGQLYWDVEEAVFLKAVSELQQFYAEILALASDFLSQRGITYEGEELRQVIRYQSLRIPRPHPLPDATAEFSYNLPDYFAGVGSHGRVALSKGNYLMHLTPVGPWPDKTAYARQILLWGRKSDGLLVRIGDPEVKGVAHGH